MDRITVNHYLILLVLIDDPMLGIRQLGERLQKHNVELSYHLIKKMTNELREWGFLRSPREIHDSVLVGNTREISEVEALYTPSLLGLTRQHLILKGIDREESVYKFAKYCDIHPFTHYRILGVGENVIAYAQFDVPEDSKALMKRFYEKFSKEVKAKSCDVLNASRVSTSELNLSMWSFMGSDWEFNIRGGKNSLEEWWDKNQSSTNTYTSFAHDSVLHTLDKLDLTLIRELNINAKVKATDLAKHYGKNISTISRRLTKLKSTVVTKYRLYYNRTKFDLTLSLLLSGETNNAAEIDTMHKLVETNYFPFKSTLASDKNKFIWSMNIPPTISSDLAFFIWTKVKRLTVYNLVLQDGNSWRYPFYPNNYNADAREWNLNEADPEVIFKGK